MSDKHDDFRRISNNDFIQDLEAKVSSYLHEIPRFERNETIIERGEIPDFDGDFRAEKDYWEEEIRRLRFGYKNIVGRMYFFYKYAYMKGIQKGLIRPDFQVAQAEWYKTVQEAQDSHEYGVVCVKRRRIGASWLEAADALYDVLFNKYFEIGMNSHSERGSVHLFDKIMFIYQRLPKQLKVALGRKVGMHLQFFRTVTDEDGNKIKKGNNSSIIVVPPTESVFEGMMLNKWICDEAGKIDILPQLWAYTEPALMQGEKRAGIPILFGTSGDVLTNGGGLMYMWDKADVYRLKRFFFAGYMGLTVDEYGNDNIEDAVRWIVYERHRRESLDPKSYNDFIQQYPLTPDEAFTSSAGGIGDIVKINSQKNKLRANPPIIKRGEMFYDINEDRVEFQPSAFGDIKIYEHPDPAKTYVAGLDPADHDNTDSGTSDLSLHVMAMPHGLEPPKIVLEYTARPDKVVQYYQSAIAVLKYYNDTKVLIENNRYGIIQHFEQQGFQNLLEPSPRPLNKFVKTRPTGWGVRMTSDFKTYMEYLIRTYINGKGDGDEGYYEWIPSVDLLREFTEYGQKNTDRVISFGLALAMVQAKMMTNYKKQGNTTYNPRIPKSGYRMKNGVMQRVSRNEVIKPTRRNMGFLKRQGY